jgi:hypothetical protein
MTSTTKIQVIWSSGFVNLPIAFGRLKGAKKEETTNIGTERKNSSKTRRNRPIRHLLPEVIEPERIVTKAPICELL